jgi:penicillin amidase
VGFFERPDPRLAQSAEPSAVGALLRALKRHAVACGICLVVLGTAYALDIAAGLREAAPTRGELVARGLYAPVTIVRDEHDVPHVVAANEHDLFFTDGFVQGEDRLFQLDLTRRYAYGRLAEVLGPKALVFDEAQRGVDIEGVARRQLRALAPRDRAAVSAFSDGINAAEETAPLPVEFRILLYRPAPWTPQDTLAVSVVASLELSDSWHDVFARDAAWRARGPACFAAAYPLSDPRYDVNVLGASRFARSEEPPRSCSAWTTVAQAGRPAIGSNAWAAGGRRSADGDALLANDPHLDLTIPGIWYLVDLQSPQFHAAGATIPGVPGVVLGHNERVAWASTNASMSTTSVFATTHPAGGSWVTERFGVRFSHVVSVRYYRTPREFSVPDDNDPSRIALVRWPVYEQTRSTIGTALDLDRARSVYEALLVLAQYRGSPQNFVLADRSGSVAYHVAGLVPDDPAWGRFVHPPRDLRQAYRPIPFARLPSTAPSRRAVLLTANNESYERGYPYRLSAQFQPPYRAYRIAQLLHARNRYDAAYFARMQLDTLSPIDLEIARDVVRLARARPAPQVSRVRALRLLARWDGRYEPDSRAATLEHALRDAVFADGPAMRTRLAEMRDDPSVPLDLTQDVGGTLPFFELHAKRAWADAGGMRIEHLLAPMHFGFLDGAWLPGEGDEYTIHLQEPGLAQGFRAVWDTGDWNRGGIAIPSGESGEPGSGHYTDLTPAWIRGELTPLPFGAVAIRLSATEILRLKP